MTRRRVRFVNLSSLPVVGNRPVYPIGIVTLTSALRAAGHEVEIVDFVQSSHRIGDLSWMDEPCDILGFGIRDVDPIDIARYSFIPGFVDFASRVRARADAAGYRPVYVGGGTGFKLFSEPLAALTKVDFVVNGEGEQPLLELCGGALDRRPDTTAMLSGPDPDFATRPIDHPEALIAAYLASGHKEIGVETRRRKCLKRCQYCPYAFISDGALGDFKALETLGQAIDRLYALGVRHIFFTDAVFNNEVEAAKAVCRLLIARAYEDLRWSAYFVPSGFDKELAVLAQASGNYRLIFSPDSFDPRMLVASGKRFSMKHILKAQDLCAELGLSSHWLLLFGSAHEDRTTIEKTAEIANARFAETDLFINVGIRLLPGSPLVQALQVPAADLLTPTFYPIDPRLFGWIEHAFEPRFFAGERAMRFQSLVRAFANMQRRPMVNPIDSHLDYMLVQDRRLPPVRSGDAGTTSAYERVRLAG